MWLTVTVLPGARRSEQDRDLTAPGRSRSTPRNTSRCPEALDDPDELDRRRRRGVSRHGGESRPLYHPCANAYRRAALHPTAGVLGRVLPPEDADGPRAAVRDGRGAEAARAGLRLGHLRRRRSHPRRHGRDRRADQARPRARGDGAPELRRRDPRRAGRDPRPLRGDRDRERAGPARRPAARARPTSSAPEDGLSSAAELTGFIADAYDFSIGGACFPEVHPEAPEPRPPTSPT